MLFYVFKYSFNMHVKNDKQVEEVPTHAVAVVPAEDCTVLLGGGSSWVYQALAKGVEAYLIDGQLQCLEGPEAVVTAQAMQAVLMEHGTIAPDPRIPPPLEKNKLKIVK